MNGGDQIKSEKITLNPIGIVHVSATDDEVRRRSGQIESVVEIFPAFEDALDGLEGFSHIFVLGYFSRLRKDQIGLLRVKPRRLVKYGIRLETFPCWECSP